VSRSRLWLCSPLNILTFQLPLPESKSAYVLNQFERIAARYDLANDLISFAMHRLWKNSAITALATNADGSYLDLCCGTGDITLRIARRLGKSGRVVGLDFAENMLQLAKQRTKEASLPQQSQDQIEWIRGDAENLPFSDNSFDGAIISFGLRNLSDYKKGIAEMARVVKPGGRVVNLDLGHPDKAIFAPLYYFFFRNIVPLIGQLIQNDRAAYTYLPASLDTYPKEDEISNIFKEAGLDYVIYTPLALGAVALHRGTVV
jgi:demethylmenaquinone methyltransferase/2-methoxy-6-polyprenyl-1,4-benzoquinol methylase